MLLFKTVFSLEKASRKKRSFSIIYALENGHFQVESPVINIKQGKLNLMGAPVLQQSYLFPVSHDFQRHL